MPDQALLEVRALDAFYGDFQALFGVSLRVEAGQAVAIIGANGAGKSTLLKSIAGLMRSRGDAVRFEGMPIGERPAHDIAARGQDETRRIPAEIQRSPRKISISGRSGCPQSKRLAPCLAQSVPIGSAHGSGGRQIKKAFGAWLQQ